MDIFGVGIPELVFIALIALIILGPKEMQKTVQVVGKGLRKLMMSDTWRVVREANEKITHLPTKLMRDANEAVQGQDVEDNLSIKTIDNPEKRDAWTGKPQPAAVAVTSVAPKKTPNAYSLQEPNETSNEPHKDDKGKDA